MIRITVHLCSAISGEVTELARMDICNDGQASVVNRRLGDYEARTYVGRDRATLDKGRVSKRASIRGWRRLDFHIWNLVALALRDMGYSQGHKPPQGDLP